MDICRFYLKGWVKKWQNIVLNTCQRQAIKFSDREKTFRIWPLYQVDKIIDQLFINATIDRARFPMFQERQPKKIERDMQFFLNSEYDFKKKIWKSGFFKIQQQDWEISPNTIEYRFPILGIGQEPNFNDFSIIWGLSIR